MSALSVLVGQKKIVNLMLIRDILVLLYILVRKETGWNEIILRVFLVEFEFLFCILFFNQFNKQKNYESNKTVKSKPDQNQ